MTEFTLKNLPQGSSGHISRCLSPWREDVYRLLEMGLCRGAKVTILHKVKGVGAIELGLFGSRLCIANELAKEFTVLAPARDRE